MKFSKTKKFMKQRELFWSLIPVILSNTLISLIISLPLFRLDNQPEGYYLLKLIIFAAHYFFLNLVVGIIVYPVTLILPRKFSIFITILFFLILQTVLIMDMKIYTIYYYHLNSLVWNLITTEGVTDSVIIGNGTIITFISQLLFILAIETVINIFFCTYPEKMLASRRLLLLKTSRIFLISGLCLIAVDKGAYAYSDLNNDINITRVAKLYPLYQPLTVKGFAHRVMGLNVNRESNFKVPGNKSLVNYPKNRLIFDPSKDNKYNILIIAVEGLRFDMLDGEIMPNVLGFGKVSRIYDNHYSGGNASRFGIFSLMYGISGTYWHDFLAKRVSPVLIDTLIEKGYDFRILSSTRLTFPEFRKTAFLKIPDSIEDTMKEKKAEEKDRAITEKLVHYLSSRNSDKPFFSFLFYNSSHQTYKYPPEFEKFRPVISREDLNYFKDIGKDHALQIRNRYKNSVHYEDHLIGRIISALKKERLLDNTVVLITGDHGEEFYENGYFGHTSSFNDYQTKTVFVLHVPGSAPDFITKKTSHVDLVPTLMTLLGCVSPVNDYSQGISLLSDQNHQYVSSASWDTAAVMDDEFEISFSTNLYNIGSFEIHRREDYSVVADSKDVIKHRKQILLDFSQKMSEFYN